MTRLRTCPSTQVHHPGVQSGDLESRPVPDRGLEGWALNNKAMAVAILPPGLFWWQGRVGTCDLRVTSRLAFVRSRRFWAAFAPLDDHLTSSAPAVIGTRVRPSEPVVFALCSRSRGEEWGRRVPASCEEPVNQSGDRRRRDAASWGVLGEHKRLVRVAAGVGVRSTVGSIPRSFFSHFLRYDSTWSKPRCSHR